MTFGEQNTEKESHDILSYAFERGINALDTAEAVSSLILNLHLLIVLITVGVGEIFGLDFSF